ncbi:hypothetical protein PINS_up020470 [Pythium insidiosum]|nr:hypothetical protein PINS_up020470 [Pythium insidiosum]
MLEPSSAVLLRRGMPGLLPRIAIQQRDFATLKRLYQLHNSQPEIRKMGRFWLKSVMHHAAVDGSMELLQWLHENTEEKCQGDTMGLALRAGHFDIALWLREHRPESMDVFTRQDVEAAAAHGRLDIIEWLHSNKKTDLSETDAINKAAAAGHLNVVKFIAGPCWADYTANAITLAAANGHLEVVRFLHEDSGLRDADTMFQAVLGSHIDVVRYLWETRKKDTDPLACPMLVGLNRARMTALDGGFCEILEFMTDVAQLTLPLYGMSYAAANGHLDAVKLLHSSRPRADIEESLRRSVKFPVVTQFLLEHHTFGLKDLKHVMSKIKKPEPELRRVLESQLGSIWSPALTSPEKMITTDVPTVEAVISKT